MTVTVAGVGPGPADPRLRERLAGAALVAGSRRQLARVGLEPGRRVLEVGGDLDGVLEAVAACDGPVVVLASGDPGFFGIARALLARVGRERVEILPAVSSVAAAFAAARVPWDDALVVSAHGRDPRAAVNACLAHPKVAVLTAPGFGPAELASALHGCERRVLVAERLGEPGARVVEGTPAEIAAGRFADPNVVLVLDGAAPAGRALAWPPRPPDRWVLPDQALHHRGGMITKAEVRALALARLAPGPGDLVWDVGAGSGSVAVDCARHGAAVVAVDRDPAACELAAGNAARHGVPVRVVRGQAPEVLAELPDPDAAFVGGGGEALARVARAAAERARRAVVVALATVERAAPAAEQLQHAGMTVDSVLVQAARLRPLGGGHRLDPHNPVFLVCGTREEP